MYSSITEAEPSLFSAQQSILSIPPGIHYVNVWRKDQGIHKLSFFLLNSSKEQIKMATGYRRQPSLNLCRFELLVQPTEPEHTK